MLEDVKHYTNLLVKMKMTPTQFYLCWLLYWDHNEFKGGKRRNPEEEHIFANGYRYMKKVKGFTLNEIQDLIDREYVTISSGSKLAVDKLEITDKFVRNVFTTKDMAEQFFEEYPSWIRNFDHPSKPDINLKVCDHDAIKALYRKYVLTKKRHEEVMQILDWAKRNDKIRFSIANFVKAKMWDQFEELIEKEGSSIEDGKFGTKTAF